MESFEQKETTVGGVEYILRSFNAIDGLSILTRMQKYAADGDATPPSDFIVEVLSKGAQLGSLAFTKELVGKHFKRKYRDLLDLYAQVLAFNFTEEGEEGKNE